MNSRPSCKLVISASLFFYKETPGYEADREQLFLNKMLSCKIFDNRLLSLHLWLRMGTPSKGVNIHHPKVLI